MSAEWIFGWWNLVFLTPFLLAVIYLGVYAASGVTFGDADADGDLGHGDFDTHGDAHFDHGLHHADAHLPHGHGLPVHHPPYLAALTWLGLGRVPLSILMMVLLMSWGAIGFGANVLMRETTAAGWDSLMIAIPVALVGSIATTRIVSSLIQKLLPLSETSARRHGELLGSVGTAIYVIDQTSGVVNVRDDHGNLLQLACRVHGDSEPIPKGSAVKLVAYNGPQKVYFGVRHVDDSTAGAAAPAQQRR